VQIDWFTLIAQVINFLILVWLLKRFLYGRVVRAMDEREAEIASRLRDAARRRDEAEAEAGDYRAKSRDLEQQRDHMLAQASAAAAAHRQELVEKARAEVDRMQAQWFETLQRDQEQLLREFRERAGQQVLTVARRALRDLAGAELEEQMLTVFLERIRGMDPAERQTLASTSRDSDGEIEIRSAFPVAPEMRQRFSDGLREHLGEGVVPRFEVEPKLGCGVELRADSHRMAWNLESYLDALEETFFQGLATKKGTGP
jgi:F-type H+-transporting ATPase subunit b